MSLLNFDALIATEDGIFFAVEGFNDSQIWEIKLDGSTTVNATGLSGPIDMAQDSTGHLFVTHFSVCITKVTPDGVVN